MHDNRTVQGYLIVLALNFTRKLWFDWVWVWSILDFKRWDVSGSEDIDTHPKPVRLYKNYILPLLNSKPLNKLFKTMFIVFFLSWVLNKFVFLFLLKKIILSNQNRFILLPFLIKKYRDSTQVHMKVKQNRDSRTPQEYMNPVGYEFGILVFIPVENWDEFGETRTL
jgi:hypothetical protein